MIQPTAPLPAETLSVAELRDPEILRSIINHPAVYGPSSSDLCPPPELNDVGWMASPPVLPVGILVDGAWAGVFVCIPHTRVLMEVHTAILPGWRGRIAERAAALFLRHLAEHSACRKLFTLVPAFNRPAALFALRAGMRREGCLTASFLKHGVLHDQALFAINIDRGTLCQ